MEMIYWCFLVKKIVSLYEYKFHIHVNNFDNDTRTIQNTIS